MSIATLFIRCLIESQSTVCKIYWCSLVVGYISRFAGILFVIWTHKTWQKKERGSLTNWITQLTTYNILTNNLLYYAYNIQYLSMVKLKPFNDYCILE